VIVGKPGSGKTVSLKFIALMLTYGEPGAVRLRLEKAYLPVYVRLQQYAEKLKSNSSLSLNAFLVAYIDENYSGLPRQGEFLRSALERGECIILLDGLDEVGDLGDSLLAGRTLRMAVVDEVARFADTRCGEQCANRVIVTSRVEGYRRNDLPAFAETELSSLDYPDEVEEFLLRWFTAYEKEYHPKLDFAAALHSAQKRVEPLMSDIRRSASVQRLAINPLLLTILAMIYEMGTRLPDQRVKLYQTVATTMIENWRRAQTRHVSTIYDVLPAERILPIMASLAYWIHENRPGGSMPEADWRTEIRRLLLGDDEDDVEQRLSARQADQLVELFLRHAREEVGLLSERSPGQIGFFHLTLEEYLAAVDIARQETDERRRRVSQHWANPRWQEVLLLTAGQLMLNASQALNTYIQDLRSLEESGAADTLGRSALLAGRAVVEVGRDYFTARVVRDVRGDLKILMQDLDPESGAPLPDGRVPIDVRAAAADILDELGWQPEGLYQFIQIPVPSRLKPALEEFWIGKYPVTNLQYARFLRPENFSRENKDLWCNFPRFDDQGGYIGDWGDEGWEALQTMLAAESTTLGQAVLHPRLWHDPRFGIARKMAPVIAITWFEANAYCKWLMQHWDGLEEARTHPVYKPRQIRLPLEQEWETAAGKQAWVDVGKAADWEESADPWDRPGAITRDKEQVQARANVSGLVGRTTPVGMYPLGLSHPYRLADLAGNVWEWQANYYDKDHDALGLRGGSWRQLEPRPFRCPQR
jgi:formylglycine-generating enzyme required for sulfatase activity